MLSRRTVRQRARYFASLSRIGVGDAEHDRRADGLLATTRRAADRDDGKLAFFSFSFSFFLFCPECIDYVNAIQRIKHRYPFVQRIATRAHAAARRRRRRLGAKLWRTLALRRSPRTYFSFVFSYMYTYYISFCCHFIENYREIV